MLRQANETYDEFQKRMERRADILFPTMKRNSGRHSMPGSESQSEHKCKAYVSNRLEREGISRENKDKVKKLKNLPLGKSIYDDDDLPSIKNTGKIKSELEPLVEAVKEEKNSEQKSRKERTPEEEEEFLNDFYPSMKHLGKDKVNKTDDEISISKQNNRRTNDKDKHSEKFENDKEGTFTGGATKIPETISNNENKQVDKIDNTVFSDNARKKARNFIQGAEYFSENAYQDEKGIWTIGYGHTKGVKPGDKINREEAEKLYAEDFKIHSEPLKHVKVPLNDNEKAALASLVFNIGEPQFKNSTVLRKLNEGDKKATAEAFKLFCKESKTKMIDGKPVKKLEFSKGLYNRRVKEMELFLTPDDK